jgi:hypothetical protein
MSAASRSAADRVAKRKKASCRHVDFRLMGPPLIGPHWRSLNLGAMPDRSGIVEGFFSRQAFQARGPLRRISTCVASGKDGTHGRYKTGLRRYPTATTIVKFSNRGASSTGQSPAHRGGISCLYELLEVPLASRHVGRPPLYRNIHSRIGSGQPASGKRIGHATCRQTIAEESIAADHR